MERTRNYGHMYGVFFFQAEDGIRDATVTGVQTCALPISVAGHEEGNRAHAAISRNPCATRTSLELERRTGIGRASCRETVKSPVNVNLLKQLQQLNGLETVVITTGANKQRLSHTPRSRCQ